jgi:hypothetical protein
MDLKRAQSGRGKGGILMNNGKKNNLLKAEMK